MLLAYIDECGASRNWKEDIANQPFYVLVAVLLHATEVPALWELVQRDIDAVGLQSFPGTLGRGAEIKARDVDTGAGYWQKHPDQRARVRDIILGAPSAKGTALVVVIDKQRHLDQYVTPADPALLAVEYLLERIEMIAREASDSAVCICDQDRRREPEIVEVVQTLAAEGSDIFYHSKAYGQFVQKRQHFPHILEFHFGQSQNSVGLQIADFYARTVYSWRKEGKDDDYPGWSLVQRTLFTWEGKVEGYGYKEFP